MYLLQKTHLFTFNFFLVHINVTIPKFKNWVLTKKNCFKAYCCKGHDGIFVCISDYRKFIRQWFECYLLPEKSEICVLIWKFLSLVKLLIFIPIPFMICSQTILFCRRTLLNKLLGSVSNKTTKKTFFYFSHESF